MSFAFWLNVAIAVCGIWNAWLDHGQTLSEFRNAMGDQRAKKGRKLLLLWGIPILSIAALPFTAWESISSERRTNNLSQSLESTSNRLVRTESNLFLTQLGFDSMTKQSKARTITKEQRDTFISLAKNGPMCPLQVATVPRANSETSRYFDQIVEVLRSAGYEVTETDFNISGFKLESGKSVVLLFKGEKDHPSIVDQTPINHLSYLFLMASISTAGIQNSNIGSDEIIVVVTEKN